MLVNPYYHLPLSVRQNFTAQCPPELMDVPDSIKNNLPDFSRFLYAYLEWLQTSRPPSRVDIDNLPEEFVAQLKYELAVSFPDQNKILDSLEVLPEGVSDIDQFYGDNVLTSFPLSYDINSEIVLSYDVVIKDLYQGVIELTEGIDYVFRDKVIFLIDNGDIFAGKPLTSDQNLIVTYHLKDGSKVSSYSNRNPINYKKFLKKIKDFYQSKGSSASFNFIFNLLYNESIRISYPKEKIFRLSSNAYEKERRIFVTKNSIYPEYVQIKQVKFTSSLGVMSVDGFYEVGEINGNVVQSISSDSLEYGSAPEVGERVILVDQNGYNYVERVLPIVTEIKVKNSGNYYEVGNTILVRYKDTFATAMVNNIQSGSVDSVKVIDGGKNYRVGEVIVFNNPQSNYGTPARAIVTAVDETGSVLGIKIVNPGYGYKLKPEFTSEKYFYKVYYDSMNLQSIKYSLVTMNYLKRYYTFDLMPVEMINAYNQLLVNTFNNYISFNSSDQYSDDEFLEYIDFSKALNSALKIYGLESLEVNENIQYQFQTGLSEIDWGINTVYQRVLQETNSEKLAGFIQFKIEFLVKQNYREQFKRDFDIDFEFDRYDTLLLAIRNEVEFYSYDFCFDNNIEITWDMDTLLDNVFSENLIVSRYLKIQQSVNNFFSNVSLSDESKRQNVINETIRNLNNRINFIIYDYDNRISLFESGIINLMKQSADDSHKLRYKNLLGIVKNDNVLLKDIEIDEIGYINEAASTKNIGVGLKLDISSTIGRIKSLVLTNPGGYIEPDLANIDIVDYNGSGEFELKFGTVYQTPPRLTERGAILSSENCYLSDNYYYQEYSYVVHSTKIIDEWAPYIKKLCHPAGMKFFGSMNIPTLHIKLGIRDHEIKYLIQIINDLTNYKGSGENLSPVLEKRTCWVNILPPQHVVSSSYRSFDRFKFEIDNENANKYVNKFFWDRDDLVPKTHTQYILADTPAESHGFLEMSVDEVEKKYYKYFHPRPDSFINVYPKTYFVRREEKYLPGTAALGATYRSFEVNKVFSDTEENEAFDFDRDRGDPSLFNDSNSIDKDTMSLETLEKYSKVKANFAISARVFIRKNN